MELSIVYSLTGPTGERIAFGNTNAALEDPDYVGWLDPENGITGLLDGAPIRESVQNRVDGDGALHGPFFASGRSGTINGVIDPNAEPEQRNALEQKIKLASRALRADALLRWTPTGSSLERQIRVRRQALAITGRRPKAFQLSVTSPEAHVVSSSEASLVITPGASAGELGFSEPISEPLSSPLNVTAQQYVTNQGDEETWPRFRIDGPITNPEILNNTTGKRIRLVYTLLSGEYLEVNSEIPSVLLGGTADRYSAYDFETSEWWTLKAGANDIRLLASSYSQRGERDGLLEARMGLERS